MKRIPKKGGLLATNIQLDIGLLLLRVGLGGTMLIQHGFPHLLNFQNEAANFQQIFDLDAKTSLALAVLAEAGCSFLIILGIHTRKAALLLSLAMAAAFIFVHGSSFQGEQSGELAFIYLIGASVLAITGSGTYSIKSL